MIRFISYSGKYPNLCSGILTVEINGKTKTFGICDADYPKFWVSGGQISFDKNWNENITKGNWELNANQNDYPKSIWKLMPQLIQLMNDNVQYGCCGGCV